MDSFLGKWRLIKNNDFNLFLIFTQTSWIERTVAENSNINVEIKKITDKSYSKSIESYFYNANENIVYLNIIILLTFCSKSLDK